MLTNILPSTNTEPSWQSVMEKFPLVLGHFCITLSQVLRWQFLMFSPTYSLACPYLYLPIVVLINMQLTCYCPTNIDVIIVVVLNVRRNLCRKKN